MLARQAQLSRRALALPLRRAPAAAIARLPRTITSVPSLTSTSTLRGVRFYAQGPPGGGFPHRGYPQQPPQQQGPEKGETLKQFTVDLTEMAEKGKLDPVIGRDDEIRRTIQILARRSKSNPALIGMLTEVDCS